MLAVVVGLLFALGVWLIVSEVESRRRLEVELGLVHEGGGVREEDLVQRVLRMDREQKRRLGDNSRFAVRLRLAGIGMGARTYWALVGSGGALLGVVGFVAKSPAAGAILFVAALAVGYTYVERRALRAQAKLKSQVSSFIGTVGAALGAGASVQSAVRRASQAIPAPLGPEIGRLLAQVALDREPMSHLFARLSAWLLSPGLAVFANALDIAERERSTGMGSIMLGIADDLRKGQALEIERKAKLTEYIRMYNVFIAAPVLSLVVIVFFAPSLWASIVGSTFGLVVLVVEAVTIPGSYLFMRSETSMADILGR